MVEFRCDFCDQQQKPMSHLFSLTTLEVFSDEMNEKSSTHVTETVNIGVKIPERGTGCGELKQRPG